MDACLRRAGPRASGLLLQAARENAEFYQTLKALAGKRSGGSAPTSFDATTSPPSSPPPPPPPPPKACARAEGALLLDCSSDDGDLFSRDGSSSSSDDISCSDFHLSLDDTSSSDADALVAFARACSLASATWRSEAAAHAPMLLQRMCTRAREMAEASRSDCSGWGAAVAAAAFTSHLARVSLLLLPLLPRAHCQDQQMSSRHQERARGYGARLAGVADDEEAHLARWSGPARLHENAHRPQHQHQHQHLHENSLRLTWMNVWRSCR